jgi:2-dehydro-3-deoxygalactonokinase
VRLVERDGLGRCAFLVRVAALDNVYDAARRAAFWVGSVVGDDVVQFARHPILRDEVPVWVGGSATLRRLYSRTLAALHDGPVCSLSGDDAERASAIGALAVARRVRERKG